MKTITKKQIENILEKSKILFLKNDSCLLSNNTNERSLTHKFAEYLQMVIGSSWCVDCEYNRYGNDSKKIIYEMKELVDPYLEGIQIDDITAKTVYPDIIVHKRGIGGPNLLVIEAKKDTGNEGRLKDIKKLQNIKNKYNYNFAVFINFITRNNKIEWEFCD